MRLGRLAPCLAGLAVAIASVAHGEARAPGGGRAVAAAASAGCPPEMVRVRDYCVDRWEASTVDRATGQPLSPYYPPHPKLAREVFRAWELARPLMGHEPAHEMPLPALSDWQRTHSYSPEAVSRPGAIPQAYLSSYVARRACKNAKKRLCTREEWTTACRSEKNTKFPYGDSFERQRCNVWRYVHPAFELHENSSIGHRDPRLNLLVNEDVDPLLRPTGATKGCASHWGTDAIYDMVGNLDEWVEDESGVFLGGFYSRSTTQGCEAQVTNHSPIYYDYSTGFRCCRDASATE